MEENYTRFINITANNLYGDTKEYKVPTMEEYNDYRRRVDLYHKELESRIAALESGTEKKSPQKEEKRLWKIRIYETRIYGCSDYNTYFSDLKELTESEAVKW